jgi:4-aminobutyrate aminotransferase-like enzyme
VGLQNLAVLESEGLVERAAVLGARLLEGLRTLAALPAVGDVRGLGLMCAVELVEDKGTRAPAVGLGARVVAEMRRRGVFTRFRGGAGGAFPIGDTILLAPPLVTTEEQIDRILSVLHDALRAAAA